MLVACACSCLVLLVELLSLDNEREGTVFCTNTLCCRTSASFTFSVPSHYLNFGGHVMKHVLRYFVALLVGSSFAFSASAADVNLGYQLVLGPWKAKMKEIGKNGLGGKSVELIQFNSGADVISALAAKAVDISLNGSSPTAAGFSRGIPLHVIYVYDNINDAEALVVKKGIKTPKDLVGKKIAVPYGSTTHFHMMFALQANGVDPKKVDVLDMSPPDMVAAWKRGDIDGGFVWDPALSTLKRNGSVLLSSGDLSRMDPRKATFDAMVARKAFTSENADFTCKFVKLVSEADADYREKPAMYAPGTKNAMMIADSLGAKQGDVAGVLALYDYPTIDQQISKAWLGGGVAKALKSTAEFLAEQGRIDKALKSYKGAVTTKFVKMVKAGKC